MLSLFVYSSVEAGTPLESWLLLDAPSHVSSVWCLSVNAPGKDSMPMWDLFRVICLILWTSSTACYSKEAMLTNSLEHFATHFTTFSTQQIFVRRDIPNDEPLPIPPPPNYTWLEWSAYTLRFEGLFAVCHSGCVVQEYRIQTRMLPLGVWEGWVCRHKTQDQLQKTARNQKQLESLTPVGPCTQGQKTRSDSQCQRQTSAVTKESPAFTPKTANNPTNSSPVTLLSAVVKSANLSFLFDWEHLTRKLLFHLETEPAWKDALTFSG